MEDLKKAFRFMKERHSSEPDDKSAYLVKRQAAGICFLLMLFLQLSFQTS
jgi:hypothetical protein